MANKKFSENNDSQPQKIDDCELNQAYSIECPIQMDLIEDYFDIKRVSEPNKIVIVQQDSAQDKEKNNQFSIKNTSPNNKYFLNVKKKESNLSVALSNNSSFSWKKNNERTDDEFFCCENTDFNTSSILLSSCSQSDLINSSTAYTDTLDSSKSYIAKAQLSQRDHRLLKRKKNKTLKSKFAQNESKLDKFVTQCSKILFYQIKFSKDQGPVASNEADAFNEAEFLPSLNLISSSGSFAGKSLYPIYIFNLNEEKLNSDIPVNEDTEYFQNNPSKSPSACIKLKTRKDEERNFANLRKKIADLIINITNGLKFDFETVAIAMIYIERLTSRTAIKLNLNNWRPILITSLILASKFWEDCRFTNCDFIEFANFSITNLYIMEIRFAQFLEYSFYVGREEYDSFLSKIQLLYSNLKRHEKSEQKKAEFRKYGIMKSFKNKCSGLIN